MAPMTVYWHVGDREELLDALVADALGRFTVRAPDHGTWSERMASALTDLRGQLLLHSEVIPLLARHRRLSPAVITVGAGVLELAVELGLDERDTVHVFRTVIWHTLGSVFVESFLADRVLFATPSVTQEVFAEAIRATGDVGGATRSLERELRRSTPTTCSATARPACSRASNETLAPGADRAPPYTRAVTFRAVLLDFYGTLARATHWVSVDDVLAEHGVELERRASATATGTTASTGSSTSSTPQSRDHYVAWQRKRILSMLVGDRRPPRRVRGDRRQAARRERDPGPRAYAEAARGARRRCGPRACALAICSNWDWDLAEAVEEVGLTGRGRRRRVVGVGRRPQAPPADLRAHARRRSASTAGRRALRRRHVGPRRRRPPGGRA